MTMNPNQNSRSILTLGLSSFWLVCPLCGSVNTEQATQCDCGFDFRKGRKPNPACPDLPERIAEWKLEPELAFPIPRRVALRKGYIVGAVLCAVLYLGLAVLFFRAEHAAIFWTIPIPFGVIPLICLAEEWMRQRSKLLVSSGTATCGIVVERTCRPGHKGSIHWRSVIAYETPARRNIRIDSLDYCGFNVGDTLTVLYLPEAPEKAMLYKDCNYKAVALPEERSA